MVRSELTVVVADGHVLIRRGLRALLSEISDDVTVIEASDVDTLQQAMETTSGVSLALVDLRILGMDGGRQLNELALRYPNVPMIVISALNTPEIVRRVLNISVVHAFVPKSYDIAHLRLAIETALQGKKLPFTPADQLPDEQPKGLTPRQAQVRSLLRQGLSNKLIASALGISEGTVKNHITDIFRLLNATNRTQAARLDIDST